MRPKSGRFSARALLGEQAQLADIGADMRAALHRQLPRDQVDRLHAVGAFVDRGDARIAQHLRGAGLLDIAHAAMHLHAERGDIEGDVGGEGLGHRREQLRPRLPVDAGEAVTRARAEIAGEARRRSRWRALAAVRPRIVISMRRTSGCSAIEAHPLAASAGRAALPPLMRIGCRLLQRPLRLADALDADHQPRVVHHGEHAGEAAILLADQPGDGARLVAEAAVAVDHRAGRRAMDAELVLEPGAEDVVPRAGLAFAVGQELRHEEERDALRAGAARRAAAPARDARCCPARSCSP